ncbi:MAG: DUF308 domain-containing protein [Novosphingobium sp.]
MTTTAAYTANRSTAESPNRWLKTYYSGRALFSFFWVALAFTFGKSQPAVGIALLVAYPLWDCLANYVDASRNGGWRANPSQLLNAVVSAVVAAGVIATVGADLHLTIGVIGVWAALAGILQLATGVRRWRSASAQWPQILSGGQSALAGAHFISQAADATSVLSAATVAPYAAFGAFYFAISAGVLAWKR